MIPIYQPSRRSHVTHHDVASLRRSGRWPVSRALIAGCQWEKLGCLHLLAMMQDCHYKGLNNSHCILEKGLNNSHASSQDSYNKCRCSSLESPDSDNKSRLDAGPGRGQVLLK
jgi:hypothetical protein